MKNLIEAVIKVTQEVGNIEKNLNVGAGRNTYKGVADKDVKLTIGKAMSSNGLVIFPIKINPTTRVDRWEEILEAVKKLGGTISELKISNKASKSEIEKIESELGLKLPNSFRNVLSLLQSSADTKIVNQTSRY